MKRMSLGRKLVIAAVVLAALAALVQLAGGDLMARLAQHLHGGT